MLPKNARLERLRRLSEAKQRRWVTSGVLDEREIYVLLNRCTSPVETLREIGSHMGLGRERVRQIQFLALAKLERAGVI